MFLNQKQKKALWMYLNHNMEKLNLKQFSDGNLFNENQEKLTYMKLKIILTIKGKEIISALMRMKKWWWIIQLIK
ncbi:unnamed protein product [Paramecium primaurelia]|uniref:Uncharacterized protein n=1 Tax=Paramecium primaurelia TaxID=5886 RepID=A0A8S1Q071_PARPR|nr:unnamed protein product [Paramecium primaurelia]CAD8108912.1 unnamed protein product [Paramecium primaurelia]